MDSLITEIFSSLQGEGLCIGQRHLFVRFADCNLECKGCDERKKSATLMNVDDVVYQVMALDKLSGPHEFVSLTGGEPLCDCLFLDCLSQSLIRKGFKILLETNGTLAQELRQVLPFVSIVSMDIKLSSVWGVADCFDLHRSFLMQMASHNGFVKIVVSENVDTAEFMKYISLIASVDKSIPLVIHPFSNVNISDDSIAPKYVSLLLECQSMALKELKEVRVLPRAHTVFKVK